MEKSVALFFVEKIFQKFSKKAFKKPIDNRCKVCYNCITERKIPIMKVRKKKMKVFRRLPTEEEMKAAKFNRRIEIIQNICHSSAIFAFVVGFYFVIRSSCGVECGDFIGSVIDASKGISTILISAILFNM